MNEPEPPSAPSAGTLRIAGWQVHLARNLITREGEAVRLEPRVMATLRYLAARPGEVVTRRELEDAVWPRQMVGYDALSNTVVKLRKAFGDDRREPRIIETIPKVGYRLVADVGSPPSPGATPRPRRSGERVVLAAALGAVLAIGAGLVGWWQPWRTGAPPVLAGGPLPVTVTPSIAVLPFTNMSGDPAQDHVGDGIAESIITTLTRIPGISVVARSLTFAYRGGVADVGEIAREHGAHFVLEGSVQRAGARLRVSAQLIDARTGLHVWAERYDHPLEDLLSVHDEVSKHIATLLAVELTEGELARISSRQTSSLEAYEYYLQAESLPKPGHEFNGKRRALLEKAIALDPDFVAAIEELAWAQAFDARFGRADDVAEAWARAAVLNERALSLKPDSGQAFFLAGYLSAYRDGDYERATRLAAEGARLEPDNFETRAGYGWLLLAETRAEEAATAFEHALALSPKRELWVVEALGRAQELAGRYDAAESAFVEVLARTLPTGRMTGDTHAWLALVYAAKGDTDRARAHVASGLEAFPVLSVAQLRQRVRMKDRAALDRRFAVWRSLGLPE